MFNSLLLLFPLSSAHAASVCWRVSKILVPHTTTTTITRRRTLTQTPTAATTTTTTTTTRRTQQEHHPRPHPIIMQPGRRKWLMHLLWVSQELRVLRFKNGRCFVGIYTEWWICKTLEIVHKLLINHCTCLNIPQLILTASPCQMFGDTEGTRKWRGFESAI